MDKQMQELTHRQAHSIIPVYPKNIHPAGYNETKNISLKYKKTLWQKGENAGYQHFLLLSQCFQKASSSSH